MSEATTGRARGERLREHHAERLAPERRGDEHVRGLERRVLLGVGDAAEDPHARLLDEHRGDLGLGRADHGQAGGHVAAERLEGAQQHRQALALHRLADEDDLERLAGEPPARRGDAAGGQRDAVGHDPVAAAVEAAAGPGGRLGDGDADLEVVEAAAGAQEVRDGVRHARLGIAVEGPDERRVGRRQGVPAHHRADRLVQVDDVELPGAQLAAQPDDGAGRRREVRDGAVRRPAPRVAERDEPFGHLALLRARAAVQQRRAADVVVVGGEHAHVVARGEQLAGQRLDVARHPTGVRPRVGGDKSYSHKLILSGRTDGSGSGTRTLSGC